MSKTNILKEFCPKNVLMKTKNNIFLTFLDKIQFSAILCLETYDWFCADRSHMDVFIISGSYSGHRFYLFIYFAE